MTGPIRFDNSYARLPAQMFVEMPPARVPQPAMIRVNAPLAQELGIDPAWLASDAGIAALAGNAVPAGAQPLAQVYAGHQFGQWNPRLGDGRAILLGEVIDSAGRRRDIQLKGAGRTPFSRGGDGKAWLGPVLREYVVSEAMHALGVPTTRALAAVATGEVVMREAPLPGAVLTRVASSHIRVGTFQYFASQRDRQALEALLDHAIARHYPQAGGALDFLDAVVSAQAELIAHWMSVGFIHGVMNTDNMSISGETIDYGPCAFMDSYHPQTVFSSIDRHGRYAYDQQPQIGIWNLAQLATALLPLIDPDEARAAEVATEVIHRFAPRFQSAWLRRFGAKIGLSAPRAEDARLIMALLTAMAENGADFTNTFAALATGTAREGFFDPTAFDRWEEAWRARLAEGKDADVTDLPPGPEDGSDIGSAPDPEQVMSRANPVLIARNHRVEQAIEAAVEGDFAPFHRLVDALATPYLRSGETADLAKPPREEERVLQTFCGT